MVLVQILVLLSVLPSLFFAAIIYKNDRVEKEPITLLIRLFFGGFLVAAAVILTTAFLQTAIPFLGQEIRELDYISMFFSILIGVALIEEGFKWLYVRFVKWRKSNFDYIYDGIVYATMVSLGFATIENVLYVLEGGLMVALVRAILSVPGHLFFGIFMGYYMGVSKQAQVNGNLKMRNHYDIKSIVVPTLLHTIFNFCLFSGDLIFLGLYLVFMISLYVISFRKVHKLGLIRNRMDYAINKRRQK